MDGDIDLERLRLSSITPELKIGKRHTTKTRLPGKFLKGPVSLAWLAAAAKLPGKTLHLAVVLRFLEGLNSSRTIRLAGSTLRMFGVERQAAYSAVKRLEKIGLVTVERAVGRNPIVTIVEIEED